MKVLGKRSGWGVAEVGGQWFVVASVPGCWMKMSETPLRTEAEALAERDRLQRIPLFSSDGL